ncbi:MAG: hypothetical protein Q9162_005521 [Coniocarpon cinnabarinum]
MSGATARETLSWVIDVSVAFIVLNTVFVALRIIARFHLKQQKFGMDDALILAAYVINIGLCADALGNTPAEVPLGTDPTMIKPQLEPVLKAIYAAEQLLYAGFTLPKLSLLFLYLRVFEVRWVRFTTWGLIGVSTACWIAFALVAAFLCAPVQYYWDRLIPGGSCISIDTFWRTIPPFNIVTDIVAMILPIPIIWKLEASKFKKLGVIFIFATGGVGVIACGIRWGVYLTHTAELIIPVQTGPMLSWAVIEPGFYLIAACLPLMRPIVLAIIPKRLHRRWNTYPAATDAYYEKQKSSQRASGNLFGARGRRPKSWSRLQESGDASSVYSPAATEKVALTEASATHSPVEEGIALKDLPGRGIERQVDVTVTRSPAL